MDIEHQIQSETNSVSVDRAEVLGWLENERARMYRTSIWKLVGVMLVLACSMGWVFQLLGSESQKVRQLVGVQPNTQLILLEELTSELCGQEPAEYWSHQIELMDAKSSLVNF